MEVAEEARFPKCRRLGPVLWTWHTEWLRIPATTRRHHRIIRLPEVKLLRPVFMKWTTKYPSESDAGTPRAAGSYLTRTFSVTVFLCEGQKKKKKREKRSHQHERKKIQNNVWKWMLGDDWTAKYFDSSYFVWSLKPLPSLRCGHHLQATPLTPNENPIERFAIT